MSKRLHAATFFGISGMARLFLCMRSLLRRGEIRILTYHRVVDVARVYDTANVSASPEEFEIQVKHYKKNYDLVRFSDLCDIRDRKTATPKRPLLITFDDGFSDNYEFAYPILKSHNVSAAFFIATSHIGKRELFWFDEVGFLLKSTTRNHWILSDGTRFDIPTTNRAVLLKKILKRLKQLPNDARIGEIRRLRCQSDDVQWNAIDEINFPMTWQQVREMTENGMEILSHSHTHPILSKLGSEREILNEVVVSKNMIEREVGRECRVFAYPDGKKAAYDARVMSALRRSGYELACINERGTISNDQAGRLELPRLNVDNFQNIHSLSSMIAWPELFAY